MTILNYYKVLRVSQTATPKEIQTAFINLAVLFDESKDPIAQEIMKIIDEAYFVLREPDRRAKYDLEFSAFKTEEPLDAKLSKAEKIIQSWQQGYTTDEQEYINRIRKLNRAAKVFIAIGAIFFLWSVISLRFDIAIITIFILAFLRKIIGAIYVIKNPPPPPEVWGAE